MEHGDTPIRLQSRKRICRPSREESLPKRSCHSSIESSTGWLFDECDLASDDSYYEEWDTGETALMEGNHSEPLVMPIEPEAMSSSSFVAAYNDQLLLSRALDESSVPRSTSLPPVIPPVTTTCIEQKEFLQSIIDSIAGKFPELVFTLRYNGLDSTNPVLEISQRAVFNHPPLGLTPRVCVTIQNKHYKVHVMMRPWSEGEIKSINDVEELCDLFCRRSLYKFCPGIDPVHYENQYHKTIRFHIKSVRQSEFPFSRVDSVNCKLWFLPASNCKVAEKDASEMKCPCKRLVHDLNLQRKRTLEESPSRRIKRQCPSSRARLQYMSPASQQTRKRYAQYQRSSNIRNLRRLEDSEVVLSDEQNVEMCAVMEATQAEDLDKLYQEGDQHGVGSLMKTLWLTDKDRQQKQFFSDQEKNTNGGRGNRWNMITIRMALAIYTRSPAAYKALQSFDILKLPSKSTMQAFTGAFMHAPGASNVCIIKQVAQYVLFKEDCRKNGRQEPQSDGALIFDEVKVACQLMWNSRNHQLMGLAMTSKDMASLNDVYRILKDPEASQTSYILQFIWRDLTSSYDIVGPYYTSAASVEATFVVACLFETIKLFQHHGLKTSLLVCDGGSANIATIKASHYCHGAYLIKEDGNDRYEVEPWMINPFNPPNKIFWLICPSHQLKNMVNALFSSKEGGTKQFRRGDSTEFGWKVVTDLYERELLRVHNGQARMVPRLREAHCLRDSWTKLNVLPAKIMQQEQVLGELFWYVNQIPPPNDAAKAQETFAYLEACSFIFEQGLLSHDQIKSLDSKVLQNITKGYDYFSGWLTSILKKDPQYPHTSSTQRSFLSWQTWDLLQIDVYGFQAFSKWFLSTYPTYFISPIRLSGSAVESLFSQYKFTAGGKLDSVNYTTARAAHLIKQCAATHHSGVNYRDEQLSLVQIPLEKKSYNKKSV